MTSDTEYIAPRVGLTPSEAAGCWLKYVDPYAVWALWTDGEGLATLISKGCKLELDNILLVLELRECPPGKRCEITIQKGYPQGAKYVTGVIPFKNLHELLFEANRIECGIQRFELGMPVRHDRQNDASIARAAPPLEAKRVVGIVDYGFPFAHEHFRRDGGSRVRFFWDQGGVPYPLPSTGESPSIAAWRYIAKSRGSPADYTLVFNYGAELRGSGRTSGPAIDGVDIEELFRRYRTPGGIVDEDACYEAIGYTLMRESSLHGAHVADIAAGWPNPLHLQASKPDAAGNAEVIFVQFPEEAVGDTSGGSMNAFALDAIRYIERRTLRVPRVVVNMSYGTFAGPHDGTTLLEKGIDEIVESRKGFDVVVPAGNSFNSACHTRFLLSRKEETLHWEVMSDDPTDSFMEIWYPEGDEIAVSVDAPRLAGSIGPVEPGQTRAWLAPSKGKPLCTVVHVVAASGVYDLKHLGKNCVLIAVAPTRALDCPRSEAPHGIWNVKVKNCRKKGRVTVDAWVERDDPALRGWGGRQSRFIVDPQEDERREHDLTRFKGRIESATKFGTLNTYATGRKTKVVGGCRVEDDDPIEANRQRARSLSTYTSAGFKDEPNHAGGADIVAPSDRRQQLEGRLAAGTRTGLTVRMNGTSVAAPQVTRALVGSKHPTLLDLPKGQPKLNVARWGRGILDHPQSDE